MRPTATLMVAASAWDEPDAGGRRIDDELTDGRVYISKDNNRTGNRGQYIEDVQPEVWAFTVGGYQICQKWLKDRRGRTLTDADLTYYGKIVVAITETVRVMDDIDGEIEEWPIT